MAVGLILSAVMCLTPTIRGNDGICNFVFLRSAFFDHDLDFTNEYAEFDRRTEAKFALLDKPHSTETRLPVNRYGVGSAMLWAPFYLLAHAMVLIGPLFGYGFSTGGYDGLYLWAIGLGSVVWGTLGLWLAFRFCLTRFGAGAAWFGTVLILAAPPLGLYLYVHTSMSHANAFFRFLSSSSNPFSRNSF